MENKISVKIMELKDLIRKQENEFLNMREVLTYKDKLKKMRPLVKNYELLIKYMSIDKNNEIWYLKD